MKKDIVVKKEVAKAIKQLDFVRSNFDLNKAPLWLRYKIENAIKELRKIEFQAKEFEKTGFVLQEDIDEN